ncbi:MAG: twin-arginine translocase TatA/TatE family subunit [Anaerolineales bacterium]
MPNLGPTELIIILIIVVLLFGVGRLGRLGGELGKGITEFRKGLQSDDSDEEGTSDGASDETSREASDEFSEEPPWEPDN